MMDWRKTYPHDLLIPYDYDPDKYDPRAWDLDHQLTRRIDKLETEIKAYVVVAHIMSPEGGLAEEVNYIEVFEPRWFSGKRLVARETVYDNEYCAYRTTYDIFYEDDKRNKRHGVSLDIIESRPDQMPDGYFSRVLAIEYNIQFAGGYSEEEDCEVDARRQYFYFLVGTPGKDLEARPVPVRPVSRARPESESSKLFFKLLLYGFIAYAVITLYRGIASVLAD